LPVSHSLQYGLLFSCIAVLFWGMLPVALKLAMTFTDPITLTWVRFGVALIVTLGMQSLFGRLSDFKNLTRREWAILLSAGFCLIVNYNTFVWSLGFVQPGTAQLTFQMAPFYMAFGGLFFFREQISGRMWVCFACLAIGMVLFFSPTLKLAQTGHQESALFWGVLLVQISAMAWSAYALLQKSLLNKLSPQNILLAIYFLGLVVMAPAADINSLTTINAHDAWVVAFCAFNTLVAYGAFAQAMKYIETVQISAVVAMTPVVSFLASLMAVLMGWWQGIIERPNMTLLSVLGMAVVVASVIAVQLIKKQQNARQSSTY